MGIIYIDEAGNSGVRDFGQPNLIYGGPYIRPHQWVSAFEAIKKLDEKYRAIIFSRFDKPKEIGLSYDAFFDDVDFLREFHFHSSELVNGRKLWGKLSQEERFLVLEELIKVMETNEITFYAGSINKRNLKKRLKEEGVKVDTHSDHDHLVPGFFQDFEEAIKENYVVILEDGPVKAQGIISTCLRGSDLVHCIPELIVQPKYNPFLQMADVGLWIIQAYQRLSDSDTNFRSQKIRDLYQKLSGVLVIYQY